jgi:predicted nucleotide-binding protein
MNDVSPLRSGREQAAGQSPPPPGESVLRIPKADAENILRERISLGRKIALEAKLYAENLDRLQDLVDDWQDYNRTWLNKNLGGEAAAGYQAVCDARYTTGIGPVRVWTTGSYRKEIEANVAKLQSIHERLDMWVPIANTATGTRRGEDPSPGAPIFIVHGHDTLRAESVARTVEQVTRCGTIILREQPDSGRTLIEKFEQHADQVSYAIIVLTADDKGCEAHRTDSRPRGRQNVIFEMGYFYALLGRDRVSVLIQSGVEKPSDVDGIVYITLDDGGAWKAALYRERTRRAAGQTRT